jgi:hypothetical protein
MSRGAVVVIFVFIAVGAFGLGVTVAPDQKDEPPTTLEVPVDGLDKGTAPDAKIEVPVQAVQQAAPTVEDQLKDPPAATPDAQIEDAQKAANEIRKTQAPLPTAGATAGFQGCRTSFVRNQNSRGGVRPQQMWDHYTVSHNVRGWSDVNAIVALFNRLPTKASSNFVIDSEGNCAYIVPIEANAWTQAGANRFAISFEIIAFGNEKSYLAPAGLKKLAMVQKEVSRRTGIPMQRGRVNNCTPSRRGIVQHKDGGICAGGHVDIAPFNADQVIRDTIALAKGVKLVTAVDRRTCSKINYWRMHGRHHGAPERNAVRRKAALTKRHVTCTSHGPVRH